MLVSNVRLLVKYLETVASKQLGKILLMQAVIVIFTVIISTGMQTLPAPTGLRAWYSGRYVQLCWDKAPKNAIIGYNIYRSASLKNRWVMLNTSLFQPRVFIDYSLPASSESVYYRVSCVAIDGSESPTSIPVKAQVQYEYPPAKLNVPLAGASFDKNDIISDQQLADYLSMTLQEIQDFLNTYGSYLATYSSNGKSASQHIYDACQTFQINPQMVLTTLQKEQSLVTTSSPTQQQLDWAMGWSNSSNFADQVYYGTRQFRLYANNLGNYTDVNGVSWSIGQAHKVYDGWVTPVNTATAGLYIYTPWIGEGGGGQTGDGGNYLFWDLWYNYFQFTSVLQLTLQEAVDRGFVELESKGGYFGDKVTFISTGRNSENVVVKVSAGDVFLSKNPGKQSLVITKNFEILIPAGQEFRLEGIWVACLDADKAPPSQGDKLDITLNLRDWIYESALDLLNVLEEHEEDITQGDVWGITEREDFPELSNPNSSSPETGVALPPELSISWIIARHIEDCPHGVENSDKIICRKEIEFATWLYLTNQSLPGTSDRKIDLRTLREIVSFYITKTPVDQPSPRRSSQKVEAELDSLMQKQPFKELEAYEVMVSPNPVRSTETAEFRVKGHGITSIKLEIFDLSGRRVLNSGEISGNTFQWHLQDNDGQLLANGAYLYIVTAEDFNGNIIRSKAKIVVILR